MKPGRELDALIAEKVMGWKRKTDPEIVNEFWVEECYLRNIPYESITFYLPLFSTDIAAAWTVVEKLNLFKSRYLDYLPGTNTLHDWRVSSNLLNEGMFVAHGCSAPHAICIAALSVVGHRD